MKGIFDQEWEEKELKQRMRHITMVLKNHLSEEFSENAATILKLIRQLKQVGFKQDSLEFMFFPDFIEFYGLDDYATSVHALEEITQFTSCEFAVRPFILKYEKEMMGQMVKWSQHAQPMVRRLSTEGARPRLPWAMALPFLKKDPTPLFPIWRD